MELDHIFHPEHKLTYKQVVKSSEKGVVCAGCFEEILSEHYSCAECKFFLHKLCAELPSDFTHHLHPLHPLILLPNSPYDSGNTGCGGCGQIVEGFIYHCEICKFDLHLACTFSNLKLDLSACTDGSKLNHGCHKHILTSEKLVERADKGVVCGACLEEISGPFEIYYSCRPCNFFLHKLCSEIPPEFTYSSHPLHPLQLLPSNPYDSGNTNCKHCLQKVEGFIYRCEICKFNLHLTCAFSKLKLDLSALTGGSKLNHGCHKHILTSEKLVKRADRGVVCAACLEEISGPFTDYYSCRPCNFFLHKSCSEWPLELTSSWHPYHQLRLIPRDPYISGASPLFCCVCHKAMKGFVYRCFECWYFVDFKCAFPKREKRSQNFEQLHHHPLIFQPRPAKFSCDLCSGDGDNEEDQAYSCSTCEFYVHKWCAYTELSQGYKDHQHPLSLVQGVPADLQIYDRLICDVCRNTVSPEDLVSHCARCRYFVHIRCMITNDPTLKSSIKDGVSYLDDSFFKHLLRDDDFIFIHWPPRDICSDLIQPFLLEKNGIVMDVQPKIRHFSHKQHDMILFEELYVNNANFFQEEDEEIMCDACIHPITAPYYCCQDCSYYLHLACANLPSQINHSGHHHELTLTFQQFLYKSFPCNRCKGRCNGFSYECETCKFALDLTCAALPYVIIHKTHEHLLFHMEASEWGNSGRCYACDGNSAYVLDNPIFKCRSCDFILHYECAMRSESIRHRWDREHPILLRYPPHGDHPEDFLCDMCEGLIHPTRWLYSCFQCDVSFHTICAPRYQNYRGPNIKFGGKVQSSSHPHILKFLSVPTLKKDCDKCGLDFYYSNAFECETCYYCICSKCLV